VTIAGDIPVGTDGKQSKPIQGDSSTYSVVAGVS
jgi:alpha-ketoglutarate-dependent sulfate ester dioxygenase